VSFNLFGLTLIAQGRDMGLLSASGSHSAADYCAQLELGNIVVFDNTPFELGAEDRRLLLTVRQSSANYHKNISYRRRDDRIRGVERSGLDVKRLRSIMRRYSENVTAFVSGFLTPYASGLHVDFASFRPIEEQGRNMSMKSRNDLLHVDAFPTRPTNGDRILRVFTNIHPTQPRRWLTADTFDALATKMAMQSGLRVVARRSRNPFHSTLRSVSTALRRIGVSVRNRSPYDRFMLLFHDYLKRNEHFQKSGKKQQWEFPPNTTWIVFTDMVSHAVLFGQFALEHTFIVSRSVLVRPECAPVQILESLAGVPLTHSTRLRPAA
jgi:hypothetical protein